LRKKLEAKLGLWGAFVARNALWVIVVTLAACVLLGTQLSNFRLDTTIESHFHSDDPVLLEFEAYQDLFGRDATAIVSLKPAGGVFTTDYKSRERARDSWDRRRPEGRRLSSNLA
jgi:predicted RND superfamily exporter protein